jgi:bifunctional non-homologous end joining protein LigD
MPYSARAKQGAPVAAPVAWDELARFKSGAAFSIRDADELLRRASLEALSGWCQARQGLPDH